MAVYKHLKIDFSVYFIAQNSYYYIVIQQIFH